MREEGRREGRREGRKEGGRSEGGKNEKGGKTAVIRQGFMHS